MGKTYNYSSEFNCDNCQCACLSHDIANVLPRIPSLIVYQEGEKSWTSLLHSLLDLSSEVSIASHTE